jgi:hypothetical protein
MNNKGFWRVAQIGALVLAVSISALAQVPTQRNFRGSLHDFTPASGVGGPWEISGQWFLQMRGEEAGKADFSAAMTMVRSDLGVMQNGGGNLDDPMDRKAHTHHFRLIDGTVTALPNGFRVTGPITITANGSFPPPFGGSSTVQIDVIGGNSVAFSNIQLTLSGDAVMHFGSQAINGVVRRSR